MQTIRSSAVRNHSIPNLIVALAIGAAVPCAALAYDDRGPSPD